MDFREVVTGRRMCRSFTSDPIAPEVLDRVLDAGRRAPSAGNSDGTRLVVLEGPAQTERYWAVTMTPERRASFAWPHLLDAPVLVLPLAAPGVYVARYAEEDKAHTGLGAGADRWPTPYWTVDTAFAAMSILLAAEAEGLGALFFGIFRRAADLLAELGVPAGYEPIGTIALGHRRSDDRPGRSSGRGRPRLDEYAHRGGW
ncbi:MAG TPA: nitroreductase family protein [Acidimicrobiales bacterium]|nr:nitroreductase family protein [Acidimicrobiales bacterium]